MTWAETYVDTWIQIGLFEKKEVKAWKNIEPNRQEARACARMTAYVELAEKLADMSELKC